METTRLVMADSKDRDVSLYPSGSSYVLHLTTPIKNVSRVDLVSARVPNTMYNLTNGSNCFKIDSTFISLPAGFYGVSGIVAALTNTGLIIVDYLVNEGLFIFSSSSSFTINIPSSELAIMMGISNGTSVIATSTDPAYLGKYILRSSTIVNLSTNEYIYMDIDELRTPNHVTTGALVGTTGTVTGSNAGRSFAPIILDVSSACIKNFHEAKDYKISVEYPEPIGTLSRLTIRWYDKNGKILNFRGLETNAFVLRVYVIEPDVPAPLPLVQDVELKRLIDVTETFPIPKPQKRRRIPWAIILLLVMIGLFAYKTYSM